MHNIKKTLRKLRRIYSYSIMASLNSNWFNPLFTLYFNLVFLPIRQSWHFPIYVYGWPKLYCQMGKMECKGMLKAGMVKINITLPFAPQAYVGATQIGLSENARIIFNGSCIIGTGNKILVGDNALLELGRYTKIMSFCNISAYSKIIIGDYSRITHRCQVMDTNFHFIANFNKGTISNVTHPIIIGRYCWICNSTTVSAGAVVPNKTIVASHSLVNKDMSNIPEESIIGGIPAKLILSGLRKVENQKLASELWERYILNEITEIYRMKEDVSHSICDADY